MKFITDDYFIKLYAGWLGKAIGIRYGAPVEMWKSEEIYEKYPNTDGYFLDYPIFGADDDSNGPIFFFRTLEDAQDIHNLTPKDFSDAWLNYVPYLHGFFWWGGYRISTEHTAYLNLRNGIIPPLSGSIETNTQIVAEQIGGQIFSDIWGLVCPYDYQKAANLAKLASQVSHDGDGVYGGMFIAACISAAFNAQSINEIIQAGLSVIPSESNYAKMIKDIINFHLFNKENHKTCFEYIRQNYWIDKYPGNCHIIPNAAIIVYSLLYGNGDFDDTLKLANYSGFDTDCNVGNIGTIMGVFCGISQINDKKWRRPINDILLCSSTLGFENIVDLPNLVYRVGKMAIKLCNEEYSGLYEKSLTKNHLAFDFKLPGSTHGIRCSDPLVTMENTNGKLEVGLVKPGSYLYYKTYYAQEELYDNRYDTCLSSVVMPGQTLNVIINVSEPTTLSLYYKDQHTGQKVYSKPQTVIGRNHLSYVMEEVKDALISEIGIYVENQVSGLEIIELEVTGKPDYRMDFALEKIENHAPNHKEVSNTVYWHGEWDLVNGKLQGKTDDIHGEIYAGINMDDYHLQSSFQLDKRGKAGILFRVQGASRSYGAFIDGSHITLEKNANGYTVLQQVDLTTSINELITMEVVLKNNRITIFVNGNMKIDYYDETPYLNGCFGAYINPNSQATFNEFIIKKGEKVE